MTLQQTVRVAILAASVSVSVPVHAQIPVTDIAAIAQLIAQLQQLQEQLAVARGQLDQARELYESMHGRRGMERLLEGAVRNYLPEDWQALLDTMRSISTSYSQLAADVRAIIDAHAVMTAQQIDALAPGDRAELESTRQSIALFEAISREALATTSKRFEAIQGFVDAIKTADDQKAILDLQARIGAEQTMLVNEATKLHVLAQASEVQQRAHRQRQVERAVNGIGRLRDLPPMGL